MKFLIFSFLLISGVEAFAGGYCKEIDPDDWPSGCSERSEFSCDVNSRCEWFVSEKDGKCVGDVTCRFTRKKYSCEEKEYCRWVSKD